MSPERVFTPEKAKEIGEVLGVDWTKFDLEQFRVGMDVELEHGTTDQNTNVTNDDPLMTGKIALAHLNEFPDARATMNHVIWRRARKDVTS